MADQQKKKRGDINDIKSRKFPQGGQRALGVTSQQQGMLGAYLHDYDPSQESLTPYLQRLDTYTTMVTHSMLDGPIGKLYSRYSDRDISLVADAFEKEMRKSEKQDDITFNNLQAQNAYLMLQFRQWVRNLDVVRGELDQALQDNKKLREENRKLREQNQQQQQTKQNIDKQRIENQKKSVAAFELGLLYTWLQRADALPKLPEDDMPPPKERGEERRRHKLRRGLAAQISYKVMQHGPEEALDPQKNKKEMSLLSNEEIAFFRGTIGRAAQEEIKDYADLTKEYVTADPDRRKRIVNLMGTLGVEIASNPMGTFSPDKVASEAEDDGDNESEEDGSAPR